MEVLRNFADTLNPFWEGITALTLMVTLLYVIIYANETKRLVKATRDMVALQNEELGLRKRPVISLYNRDPKKYKFRTQITNLSDVHAKLRVKATVKAGDLVLSIPEDQHYSGNRIWNLQGRGLINGHLSFEELFNHNKLKVSDFVPLPAIVTLECWAINYYDEEKGLYDELNKNPVVYWTWRYFETAGGIWVPEVSPFVDEPKNVAT